MKEFPEINKTDLKIDDIILCHHQRSDFLLKVNCIDGENIWLDRLTNNVEGKYNLSQICHDGQKLYLIRRN